MAVSVLDIKSIGKLPRSVTEAQIQDNITLSMAILKAAGFDSVSVEQSTEELLIKYLAAHMCVMASGGDPVAIKTGDSSIQFPKKVGMGLKSTTYGQMAIAVDPTGLLGKMNAKSEMTRRPMRTEYLGSELDR